ncbi:MAG: E3 binding domain-containing protein, partial [Alphaproteobacteria bacterium]
MPSNILMPALSPTMTEGNLAKWHKKEGEDINPGDVLAEIETDKAIMEVEAVDEGTLGRIVVPEGTQGVQVNAVIGMILEDGEDKAALEDGAVPAPPAPKATPASAEAPTAAPADDVSATPLARRIAEQAGIDISGLAGSGAHGKIVRADVEAIATGSGSSATASAKVTLSTPDEAAPDTAPDTAPDKGERIFISPLAARLAAEAGLDIANITGSGPGERIVKADVVAAQAGAPSSVAAAPATASAPVTAGEAYTIVPLSNMRKVIAERM